MPVNIKASLGTSFLEYLTVNFSKSTMASHGLPLSNEEISRRSYRQCLASQQTVSCAERQLNALDAILRSNQQAALDNGTFRLVNTIRVNIANLAAGLECLATAHYDPSQGSYRETLSAAEVFKDTKLLESILLQLELSDLLRAQQACSNFWNVMSSSEKIQASMGLLPDAQSFVRFPASTLDVGLTYSTHLSDGRVIERLADNGSAGDMEYVYEEDLDSDSDSQSEESASEEDESNENIVEVRILAYPAEKEDVQKDLGSRVRQTLICQPPLKSLTVKPSFCCSRRDPSQRPKRITSSTGLTIGDVVDEARKLLNKHRLCPHAWSIYHLEDGVVMVRVEFTGLLRVSGNDPVLLECEKATREIEQRQSRDAEMQQYSSAKREGEYC